MTVIMRLDRLVAEIPPPSDPGAPNNKLKVYETVDHLTKLFPSPRIPTDKIPERKPHIKRGEHLKLYRWSPDDFQELAAVFNGPHPETGEELEVAEELHPEGALAYDLPPQPAVFAPGPEPGEIEEIAQKLREAAGWPKEPTGEVAN
jgi:Mn-containing catalase